MKRAISNFAFAFELLVLAACGGLVTQEKDPDWVIIHAPVPSLPDALGTWVGWADGMGDLFLYRLTVTTNTALLGQADIIRVSVRAFQQLTLTNGCLELSAPVPPGSDIESVSATLGSGIIRAVIRGRAWQHTVTLHPEEKLGRRLGQLRSSMQRGAAH